MTDILSHLPHRHPFLLVDRVLERHAGERVLAEKLVTHDEPWFQGHFPERPVVPGVLLVEMLAQAAGFLEAEPLAGQQVFLARILDARFKAPAVPGDRLELEVRQDAALPGFGFQRVQGVVRCEGREVCTASLLLKKVHP